MPQREAYLANQLKAFKSGAAKGTEKSKPLGNFVSARMSFPTDFKAGFTYYTTINFAARKQVRKYYANSIALDAARDGKEMPDGSVLAVEVFRTKLGAE